MLAVTELVSSLQGEGKYVGYPTTFVRLHGCNENCLYCDTASPKQRRKRKMNIPTLINFISRMKNKHVCITGGEPLLQEECLPLVYELLDKGFIVNIETNGSIPIEASYKRSFSYTMDIKCPCSGMCRKNRYDNLANLQSGDEVKFVVASKEDYLFALDVIKKYPTVAPLIFSPVFKDSWEETLEFSQILSQWLLEDKIPNARLGMQIHKILEIY